MHDTELAYLPATTALAMFRARTLSPVELLDAVIARAERVEPAVNAFTEELYGEARDQAKIAEARYLGRDGGPRALEGLPVAVKEEQSIAGRSETSGSLLLRDNIATETHPVVERVVAAGGLVHARTTTPEFSCVSFTHSRLWGVTRNPWNLDYSPGGSSGGAGAALAAGTTTLATGSDIGGSIRIPASFCGVVGFKPPYGRVPSLPPFNLDHYCHEGPMARTVADTVLLQNVLTGPHPADHASLGPAVHVPAAVTAAGMRVALAVYPGDLPVDPEVAANTRAAAQSLADAGVIVREVELSWTRAELSRAAWAHYATVFGPVVAQAEAAAPDLLNPYTREFLRQCRTGPAGTTYVEGLHFEARIHAELAELFRTHDALLLPTTAVPAFLAGDEYTDTVVTVDGVELGYYAEAAITVPFNMAGRCPVLSVPSGFASTGVPTGLQIVGRTYDDATVFALAAALERTRPWAYGPGRHPVVTPPA
ncbi:amidase [Rhizohabitans arisaemae]|uniref:amidase n=1 Tax=Rhizohabitans arisaemae TaxID=2720610 RepID=UPI0024B0BBEF|nr:amidase [Rhizohabitans arisaemae]